MCENSGAATIKMLSMPDIALLFCAIARSNSKSADVRSPRKITHHFYFRLIAENTFDKLFSFFDREIIFLTRIITDADYDIIEK
jgi:hypothetical protein